MLKAPLSAYIPVTVSHIFTADEVARVEQVITRLTQETLHPEHELEISTDLNVELTQQAAIFDKILRRAFEADQLVDGLKVAITALKAFAALKTREAYEDDDTPCLPFQSGGVNFVKLAKATESVIETTVESYDMVLALNELMLKAKFLQANLKGASESWLQRSVMLTKFSERTTRLMQMPDSLVDAARGAMARERA